MDPRWVGFSDEYGEDSAWDSSEAMRVKWVLPRDPGRERRAWGVFGLSGDETKALDWEKERVGGFEEASGARSGESALEVVGVRGWWSSGLLEPLAERDSGPSWDGHGADICRLYPGR